MGDGELLESDKFTKSEGNLGWLEHVHFLPDASKRNPTDETERCRDRLGRWQTKVGDFHISIED